MNAKRATLALLAAVVGGLAVLLLRPYLQFVLAAVTLAYVLYPLQRRLAPRVGSRVSAGLLMVVAVVAVVLPVALVVGVVVQQAAAVGRMLGSLAEVLMGVQDALSEVGVTVRLADVVGGVGGEDAAGRIFATVLGLFGGLSAVSLGVLVMLFLLYYLLVDGDALVRWVRAVTPLPADALDTLLGDLDRLMWAVLVGNVAVAVVQGALTGVGLVVVGFPSVVFWTVVTVFLGLLPIVGAPVVWVPASIFLVADGRPLAGAFLFAWGAVVVGLSDNYLRPVIGGHEAQLNPALFVIGIFGGLALFGFMGVFFGPVVLGAAKTVVELLGAEYAATAEPGPQPSDDATQATLDRFGTALSDVPEAELREAWGVLDGDRDGTGRFERAADRVYRLEPDAGAVEPDDCDSRRSRVRWVADREALAAEFERRGLDRPG